MEVHQEALVHHYGDRCKYQIAKTETINIYQNEAHIQTYSILDDLLPFLIEKADCETIFFFNDLSWLAEIQILRMYFPHIPFVARSGGNDIFKAFAKAPRLCLTQKVRLVAEIINKCVDALIVNSSYSFQRNMAVGICKEKMLKVRGGVDMEEARQNVSKRMINRSVFDAAYHTQGKCLLVMASRFVAFKGIIDFLQELNGSSYTRSCHLLLLGDGAIWNDVLTYLTEHFPKDFWTYLGATPHSKALQYISIADLFINFSLEYKEYVDQGVFIHTETMGRSMMEAVAQGVPILALDSGGTQELFDENDAIGYCLKTPSLTKATLQKFLEQGYRVSLTSDYSWAHVFACYDTLFHRLLTRSV